MEWRRLFSLGFLLWRCGLCKKCPEGTPEDQRRLHALGRRLRVIKHEPELLDERGQTPLLRLGDLKLSHVFTVNKKKPWLIGHAEFSEEYHGQRRLHETSSGLTGNSVDFHPGSRRLHPFQTDLLKQVAATKFAFRTPRERMQLYAALNGAATAEEAHTNASNTYFEGGQQIYESNSTMAYAKNVAEINDPSVEKFTSIEAAEWAKDPLQSHPNYTRGPEESEIIRNAVRDGQALVNASWYIKASGSQQDPGWKSDDGSANDYYWGLRSDKCRLRSQTEPRCWQDPGVAVSVYTDSLNVIVIFHTDWTANWYDYIVWQNRGWIFDLMRQQIIDQWKADARQDYTMGMQIRGGEIAAKQEDTEDEAEAIASLKAAYDADEKLERCAMKDVKYEGIKDVRTMASRIDGDADFLEQYGYWEIVKRVIRLILPASRDRTAEKAKNHYFTGSGQGGVWAALASMWLKRQDAAEYETFVIAGGGFECFSRRLSFELTPWDLHKQLKVYAHVMDIYARMDYVSPAETICLYGYNMSFPINIRSYCQGFVGFSGPQLMYRGEPEGAYKNPELQANVRQARKDFDSCHYYTHSPWYTAMLFLDKNVLFNDGTTDGGCSKQESRSVCCKYPSKPIPAVDRVSRCPNAWSLESDCAPLPDNTQTMPVLEMILVAGTLASMIICFLFIGSLLLNHYRNDMWIFGHDRKEAMKHKETIKDRIKGIFGYGKELKKKAKIHVDRAKLARERDRVARKNKHDRSRGSYGGGTGDLSKSSKTGQLSGDGDPGAENGDADEVDPEMHALFTNAPSELPGHDTMAALRIGAIASTPAPMPVGSASLEPPGSSLSPRITDEAAEPGGKKQKERGEEKKNKKEGSDNRKKKDRHPDRSPRGGRPDRSPRV